MKVSEEEERAIIEAHKEYDAVAIMFDRFIDSLHGRRIPHNRIHMVLMSLGVVMEEPRKHMRKNWLSLSEEVFELVVAHKLDSDTRYGMAHRAPGGHLTVRRGI